MTDNVIHVGDPDGVCFLAVAGPASDFMILGEWPGRRKNSVSSLYYSQKKIFKKFLDLDLYIYKVIFLLER